MRMRLAKLLAFATGVLIAGLAAAFALLQKG